MYVFRRVATPALLAGMLSLALSAPAGASAARPVNHRDPDPPSRSNLLR
jgi:hypothetical protein